MGRKQRAVRSSFPQSLPEGRHVLLLALGQTFNITFQRLHARGSPEDRSTPTTPKPLSGKNFRLPALMHGADTWLREQTLSCLFFPFKGGFQVPSLIQDNDMKTEEASFQLTAVYQPSAPCCSHLGELSSPFFVPLSNGL